MTTPPLKIRLVEQGDCEQWRRLWDGYVEFYQSTVTPAVTQSTWRRILDPREPIYSAVAEPSPDAFTATYYDGTTGPKPKTKLIGLVTMVLHPSTWSERTYCYLEDLYVDPSFRGQGTGRALIEFVTSFARDRKCDRLHWLTHESNTQAQRLYDSLVPKSGFINYRIKL